MTEEMKLGSPEATGFLDNLAAGDHFAGMQAMSDEADPRLQAGRQAVVQEISDEIDSGDAHLMTRNQVAEFVKWLVTDEAATGLGSIDMTINEAIYLFMDRGDWTPSMQSFAEAAAKKWFIEKGYE